VTGIGDAWGGQYYAFISVDAAPALNIVPDAIDQLIIAAVLFCKQLAANYTKQTLALA
jgi:hypothetical protein